MRDHFRPPVEREHSWDELHGMWPAVIVQQLLDTWFYSLDVGQALPALPICLDIDLGVLLDLESSFEAACHVLRIT